MSSEVKRLWEVDLFRALAVIGMIVFHVYYVLDYLEIYETDLFHEDWKAFGNLIRITFFSLVGVSLVLSWQRQKACGKSAVDYYIRQSKRAVILIVIGSLITLLSAYITPEQMIRFGVLSFIGTGILLMLPLVTRWWLLAGAALVVWGIEWWFGPTWSHESLWAYILGFYPVYWPSLDYFPIIPWVSVIFLGGALAYGLYKDGQRKYTVPEAPVWIEPLCWIGQRALLIYILHLPITLGLLWIWQVMV